MCRFYLSLILVALPLLLGGSARGVNLHDLECVNANITSFRIPGCDSDPCTIRRWDPVPVPIELDVVFETDTFPPRLAFRAFDSVFYSDRFFYERARLHTFCKSKKTCLSGPVLGTIASGINLVPEAVRIWGHRKESVDDNGMVLREIHGEFHTFDMSSKCTFKLRLNVEDRRDMVTASD